MHEQSRRLCIAAGVLLCCATVAVRAQSAGRLPSVGDVESLLKATQERTDLEEASKAKLIGLCNQALEALRQTDEWAAKADEYEQLRRGSPDRLAQIRAELAEPVAEPRIDLPTDASLAEMEQRLAQAQAQLKTAQSNAAALDEERGRRADRRTRIPEATAAAKNRLDATLQELTKLAGSEDTPDVKRAAEIQLRALQNSLEAEIACYEEEIRSYDARGELLVARRDQAARAVSQSEALVKAWQNVVSERRRLEAQAGAKAAEKARRRAEKLHPIVATVAAENARWAERRTEARLADRIERASRELEQTAAQFADVRSKFSSVRSRLDAAGLSYATGQLLRRHRETLPDVRALRRSIAERQDAIGQVHVELIDIGDARAELADVEPLVQQSMAKLDADLPDADRSEIEAALRELLQTRRSYLESLLNDYGAFFNKLVDLDESVRALIGETEGYSRYIDEHVLWIRSAAFPGRKDLGNSLHAFWWLVDPRDWAAIGRSQWSLARVQPAQTIGSVLALSALMVLRRRFRQRLRELGKEASRSNARSFLPTVKALALTLAIAGIWPALIWFVGWRLTAPLDASNLARSVGAGLTAVSRILLVLALLGAICRTDGLGQSHFLWPAEATRSIRVGIGRLLTAGLLPLLFVARAMDATGEDTWGNSLGRIAFVVGYALIAMFAYRLLRPRSGVVGQFIAARQLDWLHRLRYVWFPMVLGIPLLLAGLAIIGYYYTAMRLSERLVATIWLSLGLLLFHELAFRWFLVSRRRIAYKTARQQRAAKATPEADMVASAVVDAAARPEIDLSSLSEQTRKFLRSLVGVSLLVGLWAVWVNVLPALRVLDDFQLWSTTIATTDAQSGQPIQQSVPITLRDLTIALIILLITYAANRNLPGLLEMTLLSRLPLKHGERYAITAVTRYVITIVGLVMAFGAIRIGWSKVQWLVAAMTVGLGFGLQEIFANFVSGLIILFERPVRVGDVVTVGDRVGTVTRVRMRATTIIDWDRKEHVIPNREFVTGQITNWSLSDQMLRLVVPVGIAYGSNTHLARETLLKVARSSPRVLPEPRPQALFMEFGESSLNFELRVFVKDIDDWIQARNELHMEIDQAFRDAAIEIAFPQRDIHIRSIHAELPVMDSRQKSGRRPRHELPTTRHSDILGD